MITPSRRLVALALLPACASGALAFFPNLALAVFLLDLPILAAAAVDFLFLPKADRFQAKREVPLVHSLDHASRHLLFLDIDLPHFSSLTIWADYPPTMKVEGMPLQHGARRERLEIESRVRPLQRGRCYSNWVKVQVQSRLGLWNRIHRLPAPVEMRVYPNLHNLENLALLARSNREHLLGVKRERKLGGDREFESLRNYVKGDELRTIDWKATAKNRHLMTRQYRPEANQTIIFVLDASRMMTGVFDGLTLLDRALDAALLMAHVALKAGDRVGLLAFSSQILASVPARGGQQHLQQLIHAGFDLFPSMEEGNFDLAFAHLATRFRKRALVVLLTQILDEANARQVERHLAALNGRHLPLCVQLQDPEMLKFVQQPPLHEGELYEMAAAAHVLDWQRGVLSQLKRQGALVLESTPDQLNAHLISSYLSIKARHLL